MNIRTTAPTAAERVLSAFEGADGHPASRARPLLGRFGGRTRIRYHRLPEPQSGPAGAVVAPNELGLVRAYVSGDLMIEGDVFRLLALPDLVDKLGTLSVRGSDRRSGPKSADRDGQRDSYTLFLGPTMVYSCAYWDQRSGSSETTGTLEEAQDDKLDLICRKLCLRSGMRLLDVGCGWGSMAIHAAEKYDVSVVWVTLSHEQAEWARARVSEAGLSDRIEIRVQDYRDVADGPYDAISSIGMSEHVGDSALQGYAEHLHDLLRPEGRLLNHAIASVL